MPRLARPPARVAGLRSVPEGQSFVQPPRRPRGAQRHRAGRLHSARARACQGLLRGLAQRREADELAGMRRLICALGSRSTAPFRGAAPPRDRTMNSGPRRGELLLELLSEEIPARMQQRAISDLVNLVQAKLAAAEIPASDVKGYVTPRRLIVVADGIPAAQPDRSEERRGPRVGAPQPAIEGFLRAAGLASLAECEIRDTGRGEFYFAV